MSQKPIDSGDHQIEKIEEDLTTFQHGELFFVGKFWLTAVKTGLLGPIAIIPTVHAAKKEEAPKKPPPMKYKDLPLYERPHFEYKNHLEDQEKCPGYKRRIFHEMVHPCVRDTRRSWCKNYCALSKDLGEIKKEFCTAVQTRKNDFIKYMRCPDNLTVRQVVLALGGLTGFYLGSGRFMITRRIIFAGIGLLAAGALCFPQETDDAFRDFTYHTSKFIIRLYNMYCHKNFGLREKVPCREDMPAPLVVKRKPNECPCKK